jgi:hypothetical protein
MKICLIYMTEISEKFWSWLWRTEWNEHDATISNRNFGGNMLNLINRLDYFHLINSGMSDVMYSICCVPLDSRDVHSLLRPASACWPSWWSLPPFRLLLPHWTNHFDFTREKLNFLINFQINSKLSHFPQILGANMDLYLNSSYMYAYIASCMINVAIIYFDVTVHFKPELSCEMYSCL